MGILDKFTKQKDTVDTVVNPEQMDLPQRAQLLMAELVKPLDAPDQNIINDLISLVASLSSKPHPNINVSQVLQTAQALIHQLVSSIPDPDQKLMDELLHVVVLSATKSKEKTAQPQAPQITPQPSVPVQQATGQQATETEPAQQPALAQQAAPEKAAAPEPPVASTPARPPSSMPKTSPEPKANKHMLNLIMDQLKEIVTITNNLNKKVKENEDKTNTRLNSFTESVEKLKEELGTANGRIAEIEKNMDKFIALYEIVTNQYNPFVEADDAPPMPPPEKSTHPPAAAQQKETVADRQQPTTEAPHPSQDTPTQEPAPEGPAIKDIGSFIENLKTITDEEYAHVKEELAPMIAEMDPKAPAPIDDRQSYIKELTKYNVKKKMFG